MRVEHYSDYSPDDTQRAESGLLTVWAVLQDLAEDLVLVGGLVPRYICRPDASQLPAVTMDVDLGVSLGISSGMYDTTRTRLEKAGFDYEGRRFVKRIDNTSLFLDFLTNKPAEDASDSAMVDDIPVSAVFGVDRALEVYREVEISGTDLYGAEVTERVKVCEVGPFICLKLQAYRNRAQSKDVFDLVRAVRDYDAGREGAVAAFQGERGINLAFECAVQTLEERFAGETSKGPVQYTQISVAAAS